MADKINQSIAKAYAVAGERRRQGQSLFGIVCDESSAGHFLESLHQWTPDRTETESRMRALWSGAESAVWRTIN